MVRVFATGLSVGIFACFVALASTAAAGTAPAPASTPKVAQHIDLVKLTCAQVMAADVLDRSSVMMFYWGYLEGKAGSTTFDTTDLEAATSRVMRTCIKNPSMTLFDAIGASKNAK